MLLNVNTTVCDVREGEPEKKLAEPTQKSVLTQAAHTESLPLQEDDRCLAPLMTYIDELLFYNRLHTYHLSSDCSHCPATCYMVNPGNPCERL